MRSTWSAVPPHEAGPHLFMHWMPILSLTMPPSLASSTATVSVSASTFFFRNFFKPGGAIGGMSVHRWTAVCRPNCLPQQFAAKSKWI
jgi:hypothetical protein